MIHKYRMRSILNGMKISGDKAFEYIKSELEDKPYQVTLTTSGTDYHIEAIGRMVRLLKEKSVLYV